MKPQDRLAAAVREQRNKLGLSQDGVTDAGGPSDQTVRKIESGAGGPYRPSTLNQLDRALQWNPGTAKRILAGTAGDPSTWQVDVQTVPVGQARENSSAGAIRAQGGVAVLGATAHDTAPASDSVTALAGTATAAGMAHGALTVTTGDVSAISKAGWIFLDLVQEHHGAPREAAEVRQAVLKYLHRILVEDLSDERGEAD